MTTTPTTIAPTWALLLLILISAPAAPSGQTRESASHALPRWVEGCWAGVKGDARFRERWTFADARTLLGVGYTVTKDRMTSFEYFRIVLENGSAVYVAQPGGVPPTEFTASSLTASEAVFENPAHDFPKRVSYRRVDATHLLAWIDGGPSSTERTEYAMQREACEP
jgi:hypothetical protein